MICGLEGHRVQVLQQQQGGYTERSFRHIAKAIQREAANRWAAMAKDNEAAGVQACAALKLHNLQGCKVGRDVHDALLALVRLVRLVLTKMTKIDQEAAVISQHWHCVGSQAHTASTQSSLRDVPVKFQ
jgi:hypothetical protein